MTNLIILLEELELYYFNNYDLYSANYIEQLINFIYKGEINNG